MSYNHPKYSKMLRRRTLLGTGVALVLSTAFSAEIQSGLLIFVGIENEIEQQFNVGQFEKRISIVRINRTVENVCLRW